MTIREMQRHISKECRDLRTQGKKEYGSMAFIGVYEFRVVVDGEYVDQSNEAIGLCRVPTQKQIKAAFNAFEHGDVYFYARLDYYDTMQDRIAGNYTITDDYVEIDIHTGETFKL